MGDDVQGMMDACKLDIVVATLKKEGGSCTFQTMFDAAELAHCDVLSACLGSMKRKKIISFEGMMLLMPPHKDVVVTLEKPDWTP